MVSDGHVTYSLGNSARTHLITCWTFSPIIQHFEWNIFDFLYSLVGSTAAFDRLLLSILVSAYRLQSCKNCSHIIEARKCSLSKISWVQDATTYGEELDWLESQDWRQSSIVFCFPLGLGNLLSIIFLPPFGLLMLYLWDRKFLEDLFLVSVIYVEFL